MRNFFSRFKPARLYASGRKPGRLQPDHRGPSGRPLSVIAKSAVVIMVVYTIMTILPDLSRFVQPLGSFGLSTDNDGVVTDVIAPFQQADRSPAWRAGLRVGDRLDLKSMNCWRPSSDSCQDALAILAGPGGLTYVRADKTITVLVKGGPEQHRAFVLTAAVPPSGWARALVLCLDQGAAIAFVLGAAILLWLRPSRTAWGFFVFALWSHPGQALAVYSFLMPHPLALLTFEFLWAVIEGAGVVGFVFLAISFPLDRSALRWRRLERSLPALGVFISIAQAISFCNVFGFGTEWLTDILFIGLVILDLCALGILIARRSEMRHADYQRLRWVIAGCALGLPAYLFATISESTTLLTGIWGGAQPSPNAIGLLYLFNCILAWFVGVAIWRRQIESVWTPLGRGTRLAFVTIILAIPIVYLHETLAHYQHELEVPELIWALIAAPAGLIMLQKMHEVLVNVSDRILHHEYFKAERRFKHASEELRAAKTEAEVDRLMAMVPVEAFDLISAAVFRHIGPSLRRVSAYGWEQNAIEAIDPKTDHSVMSSVNHRITKRIGHGEWTRTGVPQDLGAPSLAVPVKADDEVLAVAVFGPQRAGCELNKDQRVMLERFARRAAVSYQRVALAMARAELARRNDRLALPADMVVPQAP